MNDLNFDKLTGNGWKQFKDFLGQSDIAFYKTFAGHEECRCNEGKKKQVEVYVYDHRKYSAVAGVGYEVKCTGELPDGTWVELKSHGLNQDDVDHKAQELLEVWDWSVKNNLTKSKS
jgi:hypothetical protein